MIPTYKYPTEPTPNAPESNVIRSSSESVSFFTQSAGDFIQSVKLDTDNFSRYKHANPRESLRDLTLIAPPTQSEVLEIKNCVGNLGRAQHYLKGTLLVHTVSDPDEMSDLGPVSTKYCATDLQKLKLLHQNRGAPNFDNSIREMERESKLEFAVKDQSVKSKDPFFRYSDRPNFVLLILRKETPNVLDCAIRRICHLRDHMGVNVLLEPNVWDKVKELMDSGEALHAIDEGLKVWHLKDNLDEGSFLSMQGVLTWKDDNVLSKLTPFINFGVVLGGDGTVLWTSLLFPKRVPPLVCVAMGSLGYLASTKPKECQKRVEELIEGKPFKADLRCRLEAYITDPDDKPVLVNDFKSQTGSLPHETKGVGRADDDVLFMTVLNDLVISKASYGQLCTLDCFMNGEYFTTCSADGLIVATPTGSTAYNMSAGGSIVHPSVPAMLFTPICPHSLSFRPLVLPDSVVLSIKNPVDNRNPNPMIICRDGFGGDELKLPPGYTVYIRVSTHPLPLILCDDEKRGSGVEGGAWLSSLTDRLKWNYRRRQNGKVL